jgi:hypothetical protein
MLKENKKTFLSNEIIEKKKFEEIERLGPEYTASVQHNSRFFPRETVSVNLNERIKQNLAGKTKFQKLDLEMSKELKQRFANYNSFEDIKLATSIKVSLSEIGIIPSMQRLLDNTHLYGTILSDFKDSRAMVPSCVKNPVTGKYQNWDGQHTLCALERIATAKGWPLEECKIWINVYQSWEDLRDNILAINGPGKKPFSLLDIFEQHVYAVRQDGSTNPVHIESEQIQSYAEQFGIFYCDEKSGLELFPGAQTQLSGTIMSSVSKNGNLIQRPKPIVTKWFGEYYSRVVNKTGARPTHAKETRQMYIFFDLCEKQNINVDEVYLDTLADLTVKQFGGDFSETGIFWPKVEDAYNKWYRSKNPNDEKDPKTGLVIVYGFNKEKNSGIPFLIALIKKHTKLNAPVFESKTSSFIPAEQDIF